MKIEELMNAKQQVGNTITNESIAAQNSLSVPLIKAEHLEVAFVQGIKREDLQSLSYELLFRRRKRTKLQALRDVSFTGNSGDILGIIGSNGAGKTTLCRILAGLLNPDKGKLIINGRVNALFSLGTGFNRQLTGRENIIINGLMLGFTRKQMQELLPQIIHFSGLEKFVDQPLKNLSSGMNARLGFSIAAMVEPEILVLDEALSAGDFEFSEKAALKMQELVRKAKMVVLVSHQIDYVNSVCNRAIWIDKGIVRSYGEPKEVTAAYRESIPHLPRKKITISLTETKPRLGQTETIRTKGLGVKFPFILNGRLRKGDFWALHDVAFTVKEGEIVGIIGPNGAGKTTLCRVLTKILRADRGKTVINGETTALLGFGTGFNDQLTGKDNIFLNGLMLGFSRRKIKKLYSDIVEFAELEKHIQKPLKHYSSGMRARLGFSIAAMIDPDIFIIDEALNAGDAAFYEKASQKIQEMIMLAKAVLVVTHSLGFVEKVCTRALWLDQGTIRYDGKPADAVKLYKKASVKNKSKVKH